MTAVALSLVAVLVLNACTLAPYVNWGWWKARGGHTGQGYTSLTLDTHDNFGWDWVAMLAPINQTAGWDLVVPASWKGVPNHLADITFEQLNIGHHAMWAPQTLQSPSEPWVTHCTIYWDPSWWVAHPEDFAPDVITHEIYHCLGFDHVGGVPGETTDYAGAMGVWNFQSQWWRDIAWWNRQPYGGADRASLAQLGYTWPYP